MPPKSSLPFAPGDAVVAYLRDSGHEDQELSTEQQENAIHTWCSNNQLQLTRVFTDDAAPGSSTASRTAFLEMIDYFHTPKRPERGVVVWKLNRFARDIDDAQFYKADLRRRGYLVHSLHDSVPDNLDGRFFESAIDWMNARYLQDLCIDIKRGQRHVLHEYGGLGGTPPRGFMRQVMTIGSRRDGKPHQVARWVPDPAMTERVRLAWQMRADGASYHQIHAATHLYQSGESVSYRGMFANRLYIGELVYGGEVILDYCEPIVDREVWQRVQGLNKRRVIMSDGLNLNHPRRMNSAFLLSGLLVCSQCGRPVNGASSRVRKTNGETYYYRYYACNNPACETARIPKDELEHTVIERLVKRVLLPDNLAKLMIGHEQRIDELYAVDRARFNTLSVDLDDVRRQINNISDLLADRGKKARSMMTKLDELESRELEISGQLAKIRLRKRSFDPQRAQQLAKKIRSALEDAGRIEDTKTILQGLVDHIAVARERKSKEINGEIFFFVVDDEQFASMLERPW